MKSSIRFSSLLLFIALSLFPAFGQRQTERLGRGMVSTRTSSTQIYLNWRLLGNDPEDISFNLYRSANGGTPVKLNASPLTATTDYVDTPAGLSTTAYTYSIRTVLNGLEVPDTWANPLGASSTVLVANPPTRRYIPIPLQPTPDGVIKVGMIWVGDLDGDGEYDYVVERDASVEGLPQYLEAYKRNGTFLWRLNMGPNSTNTYNIEPGSSVISAGEYANVTVYDMDGDGMAEVIVRTSNGVVFPNGQTVSAANNDLQFISVLNGMTGHELARAPVPNPYISDGPLGAQMGIVFLDGQRPSVLFAGKNRKGSGDFQGLVTTWDYRNGIISQRWSHDPGVTGDYSPHGHQIRLGDPDNDGKDELIDVGYGLDDNGSQLFSVPEIRHGDRYHMADIDPDRPGMETFLIQQDNGSGLATALIESATGKIIKKWYAGGVVDVARGLAADIDPSIKGCEIFSTQPGLFDCKGNQINTQKPFPPEAVWWNGDLSREFLANLSANSTLPSIARFDPANPGVQSRIYDFFNDAGGNQWLGGGRPPFWGDIMGDWREEVIVFASDFSEIRIYNTAFPAQQRLYTLMQNPQYRIQTTTKGYVQASYVDYYLGTGMTPPPPPPMVDAKLVWKGGTGSTTWDAATTASWLNNGVAATFTNGDTVRFDIAGDNSTAVNLSGTLQPGSLTVYNPKDYTFSGTGTLTGPMKLTKVGAGSLTLQGSHSFTGKTTVWDGALVVNGNLSQTPVTVWGSTWGGAMAAGKTGGRIAGTGQFGQPVVIKYRGSITPGSGMGSAGTLTFAGGLSAEDGATFALDLSDDPGGATRPSDRIVVNGNLSLSGSVNIFINPLQTKLAAGTYTLATYTGTLTGGLANIKVIVPPGTPYTLAAGQGAITLTVPVTRAPASITWRGNGSSWDISTNQNWLRSGSPDIFVSGDSVTFNNTGAANPIVTLTSALPTSGLTVNAPSDYTLTGTGSISGSGGLTKSGTGTLTIDTTNDYTGTTTITGGVLAVSSLGDAGSPSSIGAAGTAASNLIINGGALRLTGSQTNTNRSLTTGAGGATLDVAVASSSMQISGSIEGSGKLIKTGPGTLLLASANTYTGGTFINGGTLYLAGITANINGLGNGLVTLNNGTLTMADTGTYDTVAWNISVPPGMTGRLNAGSRNSLTGTLTGSGTFNYYTPFTRTELKGNWSSFTGRINVLESTSGGDFRVSNSFGYIGAHLDLANNTYLYCNLGSTITLDLGDLSGAASSKLGGGNTANRTVTWRIGSRNTSSTFAGSIVNGTGYTALLKTGSGALTLSGTSTYSGATNIQEGALVMDGSLTGSNITVQNGASLGGTGSITGNVNVQTGGKIAFGVNNGAVDGLSITGNLTLSGDIIVTSVPGAAISTQGTYTLLAYTGTLSGNPNFIWNPPPGSTQTATFDTSVPGEIRISISANATPFFWTGATNNSWDTSTVNWTHDGTATAFASSSKAVFDDTAANTVVAIAGPLAPISTTFSNSAKNYTLSGTSGGISGDGILLKTGTGTLTLSAANTHTGGVFIDGGNVILSSDAANIGAFGTGSITLQSGTVQMYDNTSYTTATWNMIVPTGATPTLRADQRVDLYGSLIGGGTLNLYVPYTRTTLYANWSAFTGRLNLTTDGDGGNLRLANAAGLPGAAVQLMDGVAANYVSNASATIPIGEVSGSGGASLTGLTGNIGGTTLTWEIGALGTNATFDGKITNGSSPTITSVRKVGNGEWILNGLLTYAGPTVVSGGTLTISNSLTNTSTVEVLAGATLHLTGTLNVNTLTIRAGGTLSGGGTVNGTLINEGTILADGQSTWNLNSSVTNTSGGVMRLTRGASLASTSNFTNNGLVDLVTSDSPPPANLTGTGTVLTSASIAQPTIEIAAGIAKISMDSQIGHSYQLQSTTSLLSEDWSNDGDAKTGTGGILVFPTERTPSNPQIFFRILVSP